MINSNFEYTTNLQYRVKSLTARVQAFEAGQKYTAMKSEFKKQLSAKDKDIRKLKLELGDSHAQLVTMRENWWQVFEDLQQAHAKELAKKDREIQRLKERVMNAERARDEYKAKHRGSLAELYQVKTELEEEKGKNQKLRHQIDRDYENSSLPSSQKLGPKKITNNREKTGRKPGAQKGHKGHGRKKHVPNNVIEIPAPEKYANSPDYKPTGKTITKQAVDIQIKITVDEYITPEFRHVRTGQRVHAEFPAGVVNDVNYSGNIKAFAFLLNNHCNVSVAKVSDFLSELTGGSLKISTGMINGLSKQFSSKTQAEQKKAFADILLSPVVHVDFTSARVNGKNMNVLVCATPEITLYFAREHKGHKGIKDTPIQDGQNTFVHDHDITFYSYGHNHQECLEHILRYLKDSIDNEPNLTWNKLMRELIRETIHFKNSLDPNDDQDPDEIDKDRVDEFETRYDEILELAKEEYEYEPPSKYYRDGFNLYTRMFAYKDNHLLFLHDKRVPHNNNLAERKLRVVKRKNKQVMAFRSDDGLIYYCQCLGVITSIHDRNENMFESVAAIFGDNMKPTA